jgi:hypothetical protein
VLEVAHRYRYWLLLIAVWFAFEWSISWAAFCNQNYQANYPKGHEEYHCILRGPVSSAVRAFLRWWDSVFHHADAYVALFTAVLAGFTLALWLSTKALWEAGERQIKTTRSVAAVQARHTQRQLKHAEKTAERQLRAYVGVTVTESVLRHPDPAEDRGEGSVFKLVLKIRNRGQTPAYDLTVRITTMFLNHPVKADYDFSRPIGNNPSMVVLGPSDDISAESSPHPLSANEVEEMKNPDSRRRLYTFGEIKYRDAFETGRHTHFCFYAEWNGETLIGHAGEHYNDAT